MFDLSNKTNFTLEEVLALFGILRPRRQTVSIIPFKQGSPESVYLQFNPKCNAWLFPGGGQEGRESHGAGGLRELGQENPVLIEHVKSEELFLFTVCSVVRTAVGSDLGYLKSLASFLSLENLPADVVEFLEGIKIPLYLGTDIVMACPVHGEPDLNLGISNESTELRLFDLAAKRPHIGFHHAELAEDWFRCCRTNERPSPLRTYEFC